MPNDLSLLCIYQRVIICDCIHAYIFSIYRERYVQRITHNEQRREFVAEHQLPPDELSNKNVFKE